MMASPPRPNPYVGPRSFHTGETLYGRERETLELLDLLIAERIVLLYSPSGAGKTSLIQAALVPKLRAEGFRVLPPLRVSVEPPTLPPVPGSKAGASNPGRVNRFVLSLLLSLEEPLPPEKRMQLPALAGMTLDEYLEARPDLAPTDGSTPPNPVLILDQFEEILLLDPTDLAAKNVFFEQLGQALRNRGRWALVSMREDYLAGLDPYRRAIPTRFDTPYRLDLLGVQAAHEAIQKPARNAGVDFTDAAATKLVNDLRRIQVQRADGTIETQPGLYVEPVQLQVVCYRLWDRLPLAQQSITEGEITDAGDVSTALGDYYDATVARVSGATGESERAIREWFDRQLITEQGIRGQVLMEPERSRGLSNRAIRLLEDAHLVRADERRGATWFELAHDRLLEPVRASNRAWFAANLSPLQQQADLWDRQGRPDAMLWTGGSLLQALAETSKQPSAMTRVENDFINDSKQAQAQVENEARQNRRIRYLFVGASVLAVLALIALVVAISQYGSAKEAEAAALANEQLANTEKQNAERQDRVSRMTAASLAQLEVDPEVSLLLATEAYSTTPDIQTDSALRQALAESRVRRTLGGHRGPVYGVATSPDGKHLATSSRDGLVRVWDATQGTLLYTLDAGALPLGVAFAPDGSALGATGENGMLRIWDLTTCASGTCPARDLTGHQGTVWGIGFSPDSQRLVTGADDASVKVWDVTTGEVLQTLNGHTASIYGVAFAPDGRSVASASADSTLRAWDLGACQGNGCAFREFGAGTLFWNVAFSPDGQTLVAAADDQTAYLFDIASGSTLGYLDGHTDTVWAVAFSPNGELIATASQDGTARIWDAVTGVSTAVLRGHNGAVWSIAFTPDSANVLTGSDDQTAKLWNAGNSADLKILRGHRDRVLGADYSGDGKRVITVSSDTSARVWDAESGALVAPFLVGSNTYVLDGALNQDGSLAATANNDGTARLWELGCLPDCEPIVLEAHRLPVRGITFRPDGARVLTAGEDGTAIEWTLAGVAEHTFGDGSVEFTHAFYSPDAKWIVASGNDGAAHIFEVATGNEQMVVSGHGGALTNAKFNADGTRLVTSSLDRTARVWDVGTLAQGGDTATLLFELRGHTGPVNSASFSGDGKRIATASSDKTVWLWDAVTGAPQSVLSGHDDRVQTVEFSPDARYLLSGSSDRTARITLAPIAEVVALAEQRVTRTLRCDEWQALLQETGYCPTDGETVGVAALPTLAPITIVAAMPLPTLPLPEETPDVGSPTATEAPAVGATPSGAQATVAPPTLVAATSVVPTLVLPTIPVAPPTPNLAPGIYVTRVTYNQLAPPNFEFQVEFLNTTGAPFTFSNWRVPFFEPGVRNSIGAPRGLEPTIPVGASVLQTEPWKVGVGQCTAYQGRVVSEDQDGRQTPILLTDGSEATVDFQVCP